MADFYSDQFFARVGPQLLEFDGDGTEDSVGAHAAPTTFNFPGKLNATLRVVAELAWSLTDCLCSQICRESGWLGSSLQAVAAEEEERCWAEAAAAGQGKASVSGGAARRRKPHQGSPSASPARTTK